MVALAAHQAARPLELDGLAAIGAPLLRARVPELAEKDGGAEGRARLHRLEEVAHLHVEYAERAKKYGILFKFSLFCEYVDLEYVRIHVMYRVNQAEYAIRIRVVFPQESVNIYSTRRHTVSQMLVELCREGP